ncbi:uncharacterized protein LOC144110143 isoform X1 [Amblyomma americanum]
MLLQLKFTLKRREPVGADQTQQDLQQPFCKWLWSREQSQEPTSSCVQEVATDEEGYDSTNGLISVETQTDPCTWTMEPDMPSLFLCCMQDCNAETQATFPSKKETKDAAWGTSYGVRDSACDPMNIDSLKSTCSFRGYPSVSACSSEKA